jgi:DDE superfamily endonuclease/Helix-turn-helix of DDE superfamily endonuclease
MTLYRKLSRSPKQFLTVTGMNLHQFQALLPTCAQAFAAQEQKRKAIVVKTKATRQRGAGGGSQFVHQLADQMLMLLIYYRLYLTQEFLTLLFQHQHKSSISRNIQHMRPLFELVLPTYQKARSKVLALAQKEQERRKKRISSIEEFREAYPELTFIIDGVEQEKRKPKDKEKRKSDYSKKKSRHTRKQIVMSTPSGIIVAQSQTVGGRAHDFKAFKEDQTVQAVCQEFGQHRVTLYADSGFQGLADLNLPLEARLIRRARRNHPLTRDQKLLNRLRSSTRITVEHTLSRRKKYAIAAAIYRNRDEDYDATMNVVSGLVNLRAFDRIFQRTGLAI